MKSVNKMYESQVFSKSAFITVQGEPLATVVYQSEIVESDVVLVHGFTGSKEDFSEIGILLAQQGHRVLTFDNRGQNKSSHTKRSDGYSMNSIARDVIELVKVLEFQKPHLMGHSLGGLISQQVVVLSPNLWSSITLLCSGPGGKAGWFDEPHFAGLTNANKDEKWNLHLDAESLGQSKYLLRKQRWSASDAVSTLQHREHLRKFVPLIGEISGIGLPSHVVFGDKDDVWPLEEQRAMAKELNARLSVLPGCGHCPNEENPTLSARVLSEFWKTVK